MSLDAPSARKTELRYRATLFAVLALAAALRFTNLGWGLRHVPPWDERVFVENVARMLTEGDLNHRFYEYPGLFFSLLAPLLAIAGTRDPPGPLAYLLARGLVAACGVASVALVALLGRRLLGRAGGLAAALFLAASPVEVRVAHMVRPDVVLETFCLLALLAFRKVGPSRGGDAVAGAALGAATAVKFSGVLLVPSYLLHRALAPGPRVRGLVIAGLCAAVAFFLFTPYALLHGPKFVAGVGTQWSYHYDQPGSYPRMALGYLRVLGIAFGPAAFLAVLGLLLVRRAWRDWAPLVLFPLVLVLTFATSDVRHERFVLPGLGIVALLAGASVQALRRRSAIAAALLAVLATLPSLGANATYLGERGRPLVRDRVADWVAAQAPAGARILSYDKDLGLDRARFVVFHPTEDPRLDRRLEHHVDLVVSGVREPPLSETMDVLFTALPERLREQQALFVYRVPAAKKQLETLPLPPSALRVSQREAELSAMVDGRLDTTWSTAGPPEPGAFVEIRLAEPQPFLLIELVAGPKTSGAGLRLQVEASSGGSGPRRIPAKLVPSLPDQPRLDRASPVQVLLLEPICADRLRIVEGGRRTRPWGIAELRVGTSAKCCGRDDPCTPGTASK